MLNLYADVIVEISHEKLDRSFQYSVPEHLRSKINVGSRVLIPFGKGGKSIKGYVVALGDKALIEVSRIKEIMEILSKEESPEPDEQLVSLAVWMKRHYGGNLIQSLKVVLPVRSEIKEKTRRTVKLLLSTEETAGKIAEFSKKHQKARVRLLLALSECNEIDYKLLRDRLNISLATVRQLAEKGIIEIEETQEYRKPSISNEISVRRFSLSLEQEDIIDSFAADYDMGIRTPALIHGVTGSGKTEVYMEMIAHVVDRGCQAIMLIPEIALTFQTVMRFSKRFGDRVTYLHSKLSPGERYDQILRAKRGDVDIVIGPRSALFTPFPHLGIIIIDEEHENSYKAETVPKYHTVETAVERARLAGAALVMGSATPSIDSYAHAKRGEYRLYELKERINKSSLPEVDIVDLREELKRGNKSVFSLSLQELIEDRLRKKEQIMLFLNRRGLVSSVSCRECGHVVKCPHCDVSLSLHRDGMLTCHYCGYTTPNVISCPKCGSKYIRGFRVGTQSIEDELLRTFSGARVLRMDADTTKGKDGHREILEAFSNREADILVGTQMIVKGHDFSNVTLVGILAADLSLFTNDYRAAERTFALLTQAAGRAGRAEKKGEVVIQTYVPDNYAIKAAAKQDYIKFYEEEYGYRRLCNYPPVGHILKILIEDPKEEEAEDMAAELFRIADTSSVQNVIGPAPDSISKIRDIYRYAVYVKDEDYEKLVIVKDACEEWRQNHNTGKSMVQFDFDA